MRAVAHLVAARAAFRALCIAALWTLATVVVAEPAAFKAPNLVQISPRLVTSGQPSANALSELTASGFQAVIYLAPPTVMDAVRDEAVIVGRQGIIFINIPIQFDHPTEADFEAFSSVLQALGDRKVLVHCQANLRASTLVFLHRSIVLKEDPRTAYEAVSGVWSPDRAWRSLIDEQLRKHKIGFEPL